MQAMQNRVVTSKCDNVNKYGTTNWYYLHLNASPDWSRPIQKWKIPKDGGNNIRCTNVINLAKMNDVMPTQALIDAHVNAMSNAGPLLGGRMRGTLLSTKRIMKLMHKVGTYSKLVDGNGFLSLAESYAVTIAPVQNRSRCVKPLQ